MRCARSSTGPLPWLSIELAARRSTWPRIVLRSSCKSNGADITRSGPRRCGLAAAQGGNAGLEGVEGADGGALTAMAAVVASASARPVIGLIFAHGREER